MFVAMKDYNVALRSFAVLLPFAGLLPTFGNRVLVRPDIFIRSFLVDIPSNMYYYIPVISNTLYYNAD
jgi:hypothetical protein